MAYDNELLASVLGDMTPTTKRPDIAKLYAELARRNTAPVDYSSVTPVAQARQDAGGRDFAAGLALSMLGGQTLAPTGRSLIESAQSLRAPMRLNEADVAYQNPDTGQFIDAPGNTQRRQDKVTEFQITALEKAQQQEALRAEQALRRQELDARAAADRQQRADLARQGLDLRRDIAGAAASRAAETRTAKQNEVPQHLQKVYLENRAKLGQVDAAKAQVEANPDAVGAIGWLPEAVSQYIPGKSGKEGVPVRAAVADLGSMKIHDRSGAAVTASEFPRLRPFIPNVVTDSPATIQYKLEQFKQEYSRMVGAIEQGYPLSTFIQRQGPTSQGAVNAPAGGGVDSLVNKYRSK